VVAESTHPLRGVEVRGTAEILTEDAFETAVRIATRYLGPGKGEAYVRKVGGTTSRSASSPVSSASGTSRTRRRG
jgi:hypothetical protein